ncbi:hypothetical protein FA15DRAFT_674648 [Coprinopsis marcescibilis]|uniref:Nephrocystin 3-like N-terminal domain-containing protein n=1 Tax=Coprinopsis marcescibilis TaxID=230819 RepID=A0A5C3KHH4_COPMA|nr:hypothetical protein FA15DRAFT_674648 [Coprinopsis marcescibilis]
MSVLKDAVNTSISNSSMTAVQVSGNTGVSMINSVVNINPVVSKAVSEGMSILLKYVALDAIHDASARFDAPRCSEGTREAVQEDIMTWTQLPILQALAMEKLRLLLWMSGAAGTGKSAILQTIAETADKQKILAASFFFSYKYPSRDGLLIPTLAYQIAVKIPAIQEYLALAITNDQSIFSKSLEKQLDVLVLEPIACVLKGDSSAAAAWPKLIVIDGLDECKSNPAGHLYNQTLEASDKGPGGDTAHPTENIPSIIDGGERHQLGIITILHKALVTRRLPFRVALASRPDMPMRAFFSSGPASKCTRHIVLNEAYKPTDDIRLFLRSSFERIRANHDIEIGWPRMKVIETLVNNASGQFVYADTVIKFVDGPSCDPTANLDVIMEIAQKPIAAQSATNPYAPLDAMYAAILNRCPEPRESVMAIHLSLRISIDRNSEYGTLSASDLNTFLQYRSNDVARVFGKLHSLVDVPPVGNSKKGYTLHHKSLQDFLYSPLRCGPDLYLSLQAVLERVSIQLLRSSGTFHFRIRIDPVIGHRNTRGGTCVRTCPYVIHVNDCSHYPSLAVRCEQGDDISIFSTNTTDNRILQDGYRATLLQGVLNSMDAAAWVRERVMRKQNQQLNSMYEFVHNTTFGCRRFLCCTICSRWRMAILRECIRSNWEVKPSFYRIFPSSVFHPPTSDFTDEYPTPRALFIPPPGGSPR